MNELEKILKQKYRVIYEGAEEDGDGDRYTTFNIGSYGLFKKKTRYTATVYYQNEDKFLYHLLVGDNKKRETHESYQTNSMDRIIDSMKLLESKWVGQHGV